MVHILKSPQNFDKLVYQIITIFDPQEMILFGSWARGDARENSDIDLAFVLDGREKTSWDEFFVSMLSEAETLYSLDLVRLDQVSLDLRNHILTVGKKIYERKN